MIREYTCADCGCKYTRQEPDEPRKAVCTVCRGVRQRRRGRAYRRHIDAYHATVREQLNE